MNTDMIVSVCGDYVSVSGGYVSVQVHSQCSWPPRSVFMVHVVSVHAHPWQ